MKIHFENSEYIVPDTLILGAAKSGTTSLSQYLASHSKVYIPKVKECRFLSKMKPDFKGPGDFMVNNEIISTLDAYSNLFKKSKPNQILCDASVDYLYYYKETTESIKKYYKDQTPKMIVILRNPVKSSFSMYTHLRRDLREDLPLAEALKAQDFRQKSNWEWVWQYGKISRYSEQVEYFLNHFDNDKIKIVIFEEFVSDINNQFQDILNFLELDSENIKLDKVHNKSGKPKSTKLQQLILNKKPIIMKLKKMVPKQIRDGIISANIDEVKPTAKDFELLYPYYKEDINKLEILLNINLSIWKNDIQKMIAK